MKKKPKCDYGCGRPGVRQFKNGKWLCGDSLSRCAGVLKARAITQKENKARRKKMLQEEILARSKATIQCPHCAGMISIQFLSV
jgi:hypothetical protein